MLRAIDGYSGTFVVQCALQLAPLLFVRPGELRNAEWCEIDLEKEDWRIPIERMKRRQTEKNTRRGEIAHIVPLSKQAVSIFKKLQQLTGDNTFVFPGARGNDRPLSKIMHSMQLSGGWAFGLVIAAGGLGTAILICARHLHIFHPCNSQPRFHI